MGKCFPRFSKNYFPGCKSHRGQVIWADHCLAANEISLIGFLSSFRNIPSVYPSSASDLFDWNPCTKFSKGDGCKDTLVSIRKIQEELKGPGTQSKYILPQIALEN